jgi:hypothetical protein
MQIRGTAQGPLGGGNTVKGLRRGRAAAAARFKAPARMKTPGTATCRDRGGDDVARGVRRREGWFRCGVYGGGGGAERGRRAEGVVDGIFFARGGRAGWSCGGERKANAGADARTERRKVDQIFVSTPFFLGVEIMC